MRRLITLISLTFSLMLGSAAIAGDYETGRQAYDVGDFDRAMAVWAPAAESGDAKSRCGLREHLICSQISRLRPDVIGTSLDMTARTAIGVACERELAPFLVVQSVGLFMGCQGAISVLRFGCL